MVDTLENIALCLSSTGAAFSTQHQDPGIEMVALTCAAAARAEVERLRGDQASTPK